MLHGLSAESAQYMDMTSGGVFVHCTIKEGKLILEKILSVTPLADLQPRAPTISEDEPIITYPDASDIPTSPGELNCYNSPHSLSLVYQRGRLH
jgi:hypothetical protein